MNKQLKITLKFDNYNKSFYISTDNLLLNLPEVVHQCSLFSSSFPVKIYMDEETIGPQDDKEEVYPIEDVDDLRNIMIKELTDIAPLSIVDIYREGITTARLWF